MVEHSDAEQHQATVSGAFGRRVQLTLADRDAVPAKTRNRTLRPVCGDRVLAQPQPGERDWIINEIFPRQSELARTDGRGRREVLAANMSLLVVVTAPQPRPDWFMVDRFLGAAHLLGIEPLLVVNKSDQPGLDAAALASYAALDYEILHTNALSGAGISELAARLASATAILVGQSGVGKSSLTNALVPDADMATRALNSAGDEGRHTTVAAHRLKLPGGGALIDSPGVRDYAPHIESLADVQHAFPEIAASAVECRFADCAHRVEPDCAVRAAVATHAINERRYESFRRLYNVTRDLQPRDGPRRRA